jgi:colicin import membrane protein
VTEQANAMQIVEYSQTAAALGELRAKYEKVIFPVETTAGMKDAIGARRELRDLRVGLEKMRKNIKAPALERIRLIDAEAKDITGQLEALEDPIDDQIKAEEARKEIERLERERVERERVAVIRQKIESIRAIPMAMHGEPAADIAVEIDALKAFVPDVSFGEFKEEAAAAAATVLEAIVALHQRVLDQEAETARMAAERAELDRRQAEIAAQAESDRLESERRRVEMAVLARQEADQRAEEDRKAKALRDAEEARLRSEREAFEAERRAFQEQQAAAARVEQERVEKVEAERQAAEDALKPAQIEELVCELVEEEPVAPTIPPEVYVLEPLQVTSEPEDAAAVQHFRDIVQELRITRTPDEIRVMLEEELSSVVNLGVREAA